VRTQILSTFFFHPQFTCPHVYLHVCHHQHGYAIKRAQLFEFFSASTIYFFACLSPLPLFCTKRVVALSTFFFPSLVYFSMCLSPSPLFYNQEGLRSLIFFLSFLCCCCFIYDVDHSWITMLVFCPPSTSHCGCCCSSTKACCAKVNNIQKGSNLTIIENTQAPQQSKKLQCTSHSFLPP
jgi:hypothetical protein